MPTLHPRLVATSVAADDEEFHSRVCHFVVVACVSLLLFVVLAAVVSVASASAITGAALLLLGLVGWLAPTGIGSGLATQQQAPATAPVVRLLHDRCACGLADAAIAALPTFAYEPPSPVKGGTGGDDGSGKRRGSSVLCAVCLEDVQAGEMVLQLPTCGHLFHVDCVDAWLRSHWTCPICRCELSPRNVSAKTATMAAVTVSSAGALPPV